MNAPNPFELLVLPDGKTKVSWTKDTKIPNAATFIFEREDHTLGNLLRSHLLKHPRVLFAGYSMPHPLNHAFELKVQSTKDTTPDQVLLEVMNTLIANISKIHDQLQIETAKFGTTERGWI